jgi:hypothetical protein
MLSRRELLTRATTMLLLIPIASACSSDAAAPDAPPACSGIISNSTVADGHTHFVCVLTSDLTTPPAAGVTYVTSTATTAYGSHDHMITLTQAQLTMIEADTAVTVTSTSAADPQTHAMHTHDFMIVKA